MPDEVRSANVDRQQAARDLAEEREERLAIMTIDGGVPIADAEEYVQEQYGVKING